MKTISAILLCLMTVIGACQQTKSIVTPIHASSQQKVFELQRYYREWQLNPESCSSQISFFDAFPNRFEELDTLYGFINNKPAPLYNDAVGHIVKLFNQITCVDEKTYCEKLINIAVNGHWDADAISFFQDGLQKRTLNNPGLFFELLNMKTDKEIEGFWTFFFDGPHPKKNIPEQLRSFSEKDKRVYSLMEKALDKVVKGWEKE